MLYEYKIIEYRFENRLSSTYFWDIMYIKS